ncbi:MAG: hypothetical protein ACI944_001985 [Natronomonas sp.]|jgi:hypothetical protein
MDYRYACGSCGTLHGSNPTQCRGCGGTILKPVPVEELRSISSDDSVPDSMDPDDIGRIGSTTESEYESAPDVAIDGSIKGDASSEETPSASSTSNYKPVLAGVAFLLLAGVILYIVL